MAELPTGTVTFLFTDIEGSTRLLGQLGDGFREVLEDHQRLLRDAFAPRGGVERGTEGDSFFVIFRSAPEAVAAAAEAQRAIAAHAWPEDGVVRVRMGLHTGEGILGGDDYIGMDVHRAARIAATGHGGQVLISEATRALVDHSLPEGVSVKDLGAHRLKDLLDAEHLSQLVIAGLPADFPAVRSLDARPGNLPTRATKFIGRRGETDAVKDLLEQSRLVTLTGPGGTGKTRLSLEVAEEARDLFEDGAFFVRLAPITDPALVVPTIAETLGVPEEPSKTSVQMVVEHLDGKRLLLVLDNFEQVIPAAGDLAEILAGTDDVRIVVTSRESLGIRPEQEYAVPPLALPDPDDLPPLEALAQYEAVALFIDRARSVKPAFEVTNDNAPAVAEICARLDGLPLAIELAAARVKVLHPEAILARLGDRLSLLAGGPRDLDARQRTLRDAIAWSYDLLEEAEQRFFARLATFVGGFTLEAAEQVASPGIDLGSLDGVASLVNKSLLRQMPLDLPEPRFLMLETIREYAAERLADAPDAGEVRRRHAEYFLGLAERAAPELTRLSQASSLDAMESEHNNFRAALRWARDIDLPIALRLGAALWRFWQMRGHLVEASEQLEGLLSMAESRGLPEDRAKALEAAGGIAHWRGDAPAAKDFYEESLELHRTAENATGIAHALYNLSFVYGGPWSPFHDPLRASELLEESLDRFREIGDRGGMAGALWALGNLLRMSGELERADKTLHEALELHREVDDRFSEAWDLHILAIIALDHEDYRKARTWAEQGLSIFAEAVDLSGIPAAIADIGAAAIGEGDLERGARLLGAALSMEATTGTRVLARMAETLPWLKKAMDAVSGPEMQPPKDQGAAMGVQEAIRYALKEGVDG